MHGDKNEIITLHECLMATLDKHKDIKVNVTTELVKRLGANRETSNPESDISYI